MSGHLLRSCDMFREQLAMLFTAIFTHGYQPKDVLLGTIASIPKDCRGNICAGTNYRGIVLCSSLSKLFDVIIIMKYSDLLNTSEMQYAFNKRAKLTCPPTLLEPTMLEPEQVISN